MTNAQPEPQVEELATELDPQLSELKEQGYTVLKQGLDPALVPTFLNTIKRLHGSPENQATDGIPFLNRGHQLVYNLQSKDLLMLQTFLSHPRVRQLLMAMLNDPWYRQIPAESPNYILRSMLGRSSGPSTMPLHIDSFIPASGSFSWVMQVSFVLEDQTVENGCTIVVPGSHCYDRYADQAALATATPILSKAGDIVLWDSRLWHGTRENTSGRSRWSLVATFVRWWLKQNYDIPRTLPQLIYAQLTDEQKAILGYCSIPPRDEFERIDIKGGFSDLRPNVSDY